MRQRDTYDMSANSATVATNDQSPCAESDQHGSCDVKRFAFGAALNPGRHWYLISYAQSIDSPGRFAYGEVRRPAQDPNSFLRQRPVAGHFRSPPTRSSRGRCRDRSAGAGSLSGPRRSRTLTTRIALPIARISTSDCAATATDGEPTGRPVER